MIKSEWALMAGNGNVRIKRLYAEGSWPAEWGWDWNGWRHGPYLPVANRKPSTSVQWAGFEFARSNHQVNRLHGGVYTARDWTVAIPLWFVTIAFAALALALLRNWNRVRISRLKGRCRRCGYDLRATPDRCPECGTEVASPAAHQPRSGERQ